MTAYRNQPLYVVEVYDDVAGQWRRLNDTVTFDGGMAWAKSIVTKGISSRIRHIPSGHVVWTHQLEQILEGRRYGYIVRREVHGEERVSYHQVPGAGIQAYVRAFLRCWQWQQHRGCRGTEVEEVKA